MQIKNIQGVLSGIDSVHQKATKTISEVEVQALKDAGVTHLNSNDVVNDLQEKLAAKVAPAAPKAPTSGSKPKLG